MSTTDEQATSPPAAAPETSPTAPAAESPPRRPEGLELIGEYEGSGFKEPPSIARRGDGQVIQLPKILFLVADAVDGNRDYAQIAEHVSEQLGRGLEADDARMLVDEKLRPLGVVAAADGTTPEFEKADPLLGFRFRASVLSGQTAQKLGRLFRPLFFPPIQLAVIGAVIALDVWLFGSHGIAQSMRQSLDQPSIILLLFAVVILSAAFHEFGHAAGCTAGGACPGDMGAGLYLAWPAFYTDVTDAYRLDKRGRLRTDLAGVYFNLIFVLATAAVYFATGFEPLLLIIMIQHVEIVHQLLPLLRLDGYYIISDLTGVPDLFQRMGAILASALPWRKPDDRVTALKPWVRTVVTLWVVVVIPALLFQLLIILLHLPRILGTAWDSGHHLMTATSKAMARGDVLSSASDIVQLLILALPIVGILYSLLRMGTRGWRGGWRRTEGKPVLRSAFVLASAAFVGVLVMSWISPKNYERIHPGERGTIGEGIAAVRRAPTGRAALVPVDRATQRGDLDTTATTTAVSTTVPGASAADSTTTVVSYRQSQYEVTSTTLRRRTPTTVDSPAPSTTVP
jgi:putative peptide zinc metalloprotease protein